MTRQEFSDLIERAERIVDALDRWGGVDGISNRLEMLDEFLKKIDVRKDVIIQLDRMSNDMYLFKALLTVDEAALYLGVHTSTVYKLIKAHGMPTYSPPSTKMLILTEDLVSWCRNYPNEIPDKGYTGTQKKKGNKA